MIEHYDFGRMTIDGVEYNHDLKIIHGKVVPDWFQESRHKMQPQDLTDIPEDCEFIVFGIGFSGCNSVTDETIAMLKERGIPYEIGNTGDVLKKYNELDEDGVKVMGAFHLTC